MKHPQFGVYVPGSIWQVGDRRYIVRDDGRWCAYPSMALLPMRPCLLDARPLHVGPVA